MEGGNHATQSSLPRNDHEITARADFYEPSIRQCEEPRRIL